MKVYPCNWVGFVVQRDTESVPKINMLFTLVNTDDAPHVLRDADLFIIAPGGERLALYEKLFFDYADGSHLQTRDQHAIFVKPGESVVTGIQFEGEDLVKKYLWAEGNYEFSLSWFIDNGKNEDVVRNDFTINLPANKAQRIAHWTNAAPKQWKKLKTGDEAVAIRVNIDGRGNNVTIRDKRL